MLRAILAAALILGLADVLHARQLSRLDPALRLSRLRADAVTIHPAPLLVPHSVSPADGRTYVHALVRIRPGGERALERYGVRIGVRAGDVVTARIPRETITAVAADPLVRFVEAAARLTFDTPPVTTAPAMDDATSDTAAVSIGLDGLRRWTGERFVGSTGKGVVIGIVDTGIDLAHEDFRREDGSTRVLYAWDQSGEGTPPGQVGPHRFDYGAECDAARIDAENCAMDDVAGHGTHVAGIAAGDGSATGNGLPARRFVGVAPEADLIVVRAGGSEITADALLEGVAYIFARAAELRRPAVVNLSVSTQDGPHDGTTVLERGLDQLTGPGRILVAGAGNAGTNANESPAFARAPAHATDTLAVGASSSHDLVVPTYSPSPGAFNDGAVLQLWYDGADSLTIEITPPDPSQPPLRVLTGDSAVSDAVGGLVGVWNAVDGPQEINGDHVALIALADGEESEPPTPGRWTITVTREGGTGNGAYHLWLIGGSFDNPLEPARLDRGTSITHLVGSPATADRVIAVAGFASRHAWNSAEGRTRRYPVEEPLGDIAFFSSPGPRRDGVLKPEITAPAKMVLSARAGNGATWREIPWLVEEDGVHAALLGTSMAAPFVAGAVALLLERDPALTPEQARDLLTRAARRDAFTATPRTGEPNGIPNAQWGYGKLDVAAAIRLLTPRSGLEPGKRIALSANPVRGRELVVTTAERPRSIAVYTFAGERVRALSPAEIGDFASVWALDNDRGSAVANGAYVLVVEFDDDRVLEKIFVLRP